MVAKADNHQYRRQAVSESTCSNCGEHSVWVDFAPRSAGWAWRMVYPVSSGKYMAHSEMPTDVRLDFDEAASIVDLSPRGACALLRLALQKLMVDLGEPGKHLDTDIGSLVKKGLPAGVQQALDSVRVIGNSAVHPGELDVTDDPATAGALFHLLNFIVQDRIAQPSALERLYMKLPDGARAAIDKRDSNS